MSVSVSSVVFIGSSGVCSILLFCRFVNQVVCCLCFVLFFFIH